MKTPYLTSFRASHIYNRSGLKNMKQKLNPKVNGCGLEKVKQFA